MTVTNQPHQVDLVEPFRYYAIDWGQALVRTDTPDLLGFLERALDDALMAEGAEEFAEEDLEMAERDIAAGLETLPPE